MSRIANSSVSRPKLARRALGLWPVMWLLGLGACTSVLGIEDLHDGPRPGSETLAGQGGDSDTTNTKGGTKSGGSSNGGSSNGGSSNGGAGNVGPGGQGGTTITPIGGEGGVGGEGGAPFVPTPVNGKLIDQWGNPIGNVTVQIGATKATTDDNGKFTIPDVDASYDLSLKNGSDGWVFQGLSRRDPTLQIFSDASDAALNRSTYVTPSFVNTTKGTNDLIAFAVGTPTGNARNNNLDPTEDPFFLELSTSWIGGSSTTSTAHALQWTINASTKLPVSYKGYDSKAVPLAEGVEAMVNFDLKADSTPSDTITGNTSAAGNADPTNLVFVHFSSGAWIKVIEETKPKSAMAFSYVVPQLANTSITVMTLQGSFSGEVGMVHKNGLSAGDAVGDLKSPRPPTLLTPAPSEVDVEPTATFSLTPSAENSGAFMYVISPDTSPGRLYVVTTKTSLNGLPSVVNGAWILPKQSDVYWWVETHGNFSDVDDMTGPTGFIDTFAKYYDYETIGAGDQDGSWTSSSSYMFTTK